MLTIATIFAAATATGMPVAVPQAAKAMPPVCQQVEARKADGSALYESGKGKAPAARPLAEEPPADVVAALLYTEGQCSKPIVISRGIGTKPTGK